MHRNLAARAGRWSAAHWKTATFGWLLVRRRGGRRRDDRGHETADRCRELERRDGAGRADPRSRRIRQVGHRGGADPGETGRRPAGRRGRRRRDDAARADGCEERQGAGAVAGRQVAARAVRPQGRRRHGRHPRPAGARRRRRRAAGASEADRRRVRRGERQPRAQRDDRQGLLAGGASLAAGDLRDPAARVRRLRRRRRSGAARVLGGTRVGRALEPRQPCRARVRRDELGDPVDRDGGRRRLLALLRETRARGARGRPRRARGAPPGRGDIRTGGADLRRDGAGRDGRHAARRVRRLHLGRDRRDDRRVRVDARLPHRAPGPAREARRPHRPRRGRRGRRRDRPRAAARASVGRAPAHAAARSCSG